MLNPAFLANFLFKQVFCGADRRFDSQQKEIEALSVSILSVQIDVAAEVVKVACSRLHQNPRQARRHCRMRRREVIVDGARTNGQALFEAHRQRTPQRLS